MEHLILNELDNIYFLFLSRLRGKTVEGNFITNIANLTGETLERVGGGVRRNSASWCGTSILRRLGGASCLLPVGAFRSVFSGDPLLRAALPVEEC